MYIYMHVCVFKDSCDLYRIKDISNEGVQSKVTQKGGNKVMQVVQTANLKVNRCYTGEKNLSLRWQTSKQKTMKKCSNKVSVLFCMYPDWRKTTCQKEKEQNWRDRKV